MNAIEMTGQRFGRLRVVERVENSPNDTAAYWRCRCDCGKETVVRGTSLRSGVTKSCGCGRREGKPVQWIAFGDQWLTFRQAALASGINERTLRQRYSTGIRGKMLFSKPVYKRALLKAITPAAVSPAARRQA